jgi:hypothetical protein
MSDRLPGSSHSNPLWHRGFAIWSATDDRDRHIFIWCHEAADLEDLYDRRHGDAPTIQQARADIDEFLWCEEFNAAQCAKGPAALVDLYAELEAAGKGGMK